MPRKLLIVFCLALLPASAWAREYPSICSYTNTAKRISLKDKACVLETAEINSHFAWRIKFPNGPIVTVEYVDPDGFGGYDNGAADHLWNINGRPAWGYEPSRVELHGKTKDGNETIAWRED